MVVNRSMTIVVNGQNHEATLSHYSYQSGGAAISMYLTNFGIIFFKKIFSKMWYTYLNAAYLFFHQEAAHSLTGLKTLM